MTWLITLTLICFAVVHVCLWLRLVRQRPRWQVWLALMLPALVPLWAWDTPGRHVRNLVIAWGGCLLLYALWLVLL
jgi:hypothetical protein